MTPQDPIRTKALADLDHHLSTKLGIPVRDLSERREKIQRMYDMLTSMSEHYDAKGMIIGQGFFIKHEPEYYCVWRKGFENGQPQMVKDITRVASMFTPEIFFGEAPAQAL